MTDRQAFSDWQDYRKAIKSTVDTIKRDIANARASSVIDKVNRDLLRSKLYEAIIFADDFIIQQAKNREDDNE